MKPSVVNADTALLRRLNTRSVLGVLRAAETITLTEVARGTGLSRQTARAALEDLIGRGLCESLAPLEGSSGRPARRFAFRRRAGHAVGVSIAPRHVLVIVTDLAGTVIARQRREVEQTLSADERLAVAEELARSCGSAAGPIWAAAAGTSGVVDRSGRVRTASLLPGWVGLNLAGTVGGWFDCPGFAGNDAALAATAERWLGNARHVDDMVFILTGHRTGYGVLINGRPHLGRSGAAGELGKLPHARDHEPSYALDREQLGIDEVVRAAESGDEHAAWLMSELGERLARAAATLVAVVDPELVVVGGTLAEGGETLLEPMRRQLSLMTRGAPEVTTSRLGEDAVALGAVRSALDHIEESPRLMGVGELA